jgi:predicted aldo/keto reductase-like oxidoreductase
LETRRFGRTNHMSSVAVFGAVALNQANQTQVDQTMQLIVDSGVNHIDVAPTYGRAEENLGTWMPEVRTRFFLGCKTTERQASAARAEMERSLERLRVDSFDLYQLHAITKMSELDQVTRPGGALEAFIRAREEGLTRYLGITGHGLHTPAIFIEALRRFDFDSVLFPINFVLFSSPEYRAQTQELLAICQDRDIGVLIIKATAREPWGDNEKTHNTWYRPFLRPERMQHGVNFVLSQPVTALCTPGDMDLLPHVLTACQNYAQLTEDEQAALIAMGEQFQPIFSPETEG